MTSMKKTWVTVLFGISILVVPSFAVMYRYAQTGESKENHALKQVAPFA